MEIEKRLPQYYECGICGHYHSVLWNGDCRQDDARFTLDDIWDKHRQDGWEEVPMPGTDKCVSEL